jgi:hypothetical protein
MGQLRKFEDALIADRVASRIKVAYIKQITKAYIRTYSDSGQVQAGVEWVDHRGKTGRTVGDPENMHMKALLTRAKREGVKVETQEW